MLTMRMHASRVQLACACCTGNWFRNENERFCLSSLSRGEFFHALIRRCILAHALLLNAVSLSPHEIAFSKLLEVEVSQH